MNLEKEKIVFITTTTYSDIQNVQSKCLDTHFPDNKKILIDGRTGWFSIWYKWIDECLRTDADWFIHLDEDCFITDSQPIIDHLRFMIDNNFDISGCPDGHNEYRNCNHIALNSFFMIVNRKALLTWKRFNENNQAYPQFKSEWIEPYPYEKTNTSVYTYSQPWHVYVNGTEPYYNFMWVLKASGIKFFYLKPGFDPELSTTNLLNDTVIHCWYQRVRESDYIIDILHKFGNRERFNKIIEKVLTSLDNTFIQDDI